MLAEDSGVVAERPLFELLAHVPIGLRTFVLSTEALSDI